MNSGIHGITNEIATNRCNYFIRILLDIKNAVIETRCSRTKNGALFCSQDRIVKFFKNIYDYRMQGNEDFSYGGSLTDVKIINQIYNMQMDEEHGANIENKSLLYFGCAPHANPGDITLEQFNAVGVTELYGRIVDHVSGRVLSARLNSFNELAQNGGSIGNKHKMISKIQQKDKIINKWELAINKMILYKYPFVLNKKQKIILTVDNWIDDWKEFTNKNISDKKIKSLFHKLFLQRLYQSFY